MSVRGFSVGEIEYMRTQRLGRLATRQPKGSLQNNPVAFHYNPALQSIDIGGRDMAQSRKYRNLATNPQVAFVIDDIASYDPWRIRCLEIRGTAEAILHPEDTTVPYPSAIIRIHPHRIISFGIDPPPLWSWRTRFGGD